MTKAITLDIGTVDVTKLAGFLQRGIGVLAELDDQKQDFKSLMEEAASELKIDKKIITKFVKARFNAKTKDIVAEAETLDALSKAVDN